jgi:hypothetical protein
MSRQERFALWISRGLRLRLVGWRRWVYFTGEIYLGGFVVVTAASVVHGPAVIVMAIGAVCAVAAVV